jgi:hypothetical protein
MYTHFAKEKQLQTLAIGTRFFWQTFHFREREKNHLELSKVDPQESNFSEIVVCVVNLSFMLSHYLFYHLPKEVC